MEYFQMPRSKTGVKREKFNEEKLRGISEAVDAVKKGMALRTASKTYQIPRTTLRRALNKAETYKSYSNCAVKKMFTEQEESELSKYLQTASKMHYGLSRTDLMKFVYEYAVAIGRKIPESWETNKSAGKQWYYDFMKRHNELSLRSPEATSLSRATSFNKHNVSLFFDNLSAVFEKHEITPDRVYNVDETSNTTVHAPDKIIACKGVKQVGSVTSGERGANVTVIGCVNAMGNSIPPLFVFPRVNFKQHMLKGGPVNCIGTAHPSGWSNTVIFHNYLKHFITHAKPCLSNPVLLILDNHESHCSLEVVRLAKESGIIMLTIPPHTSHKLQPLDRSVFGPYKSYYNTACREWMLIHPGVPISIYEVAELCGRAYPLAFTPVNIQSGFRAAGIWPLNRHIFQEYEFMSSSVTDRPDPNVEVQQSNEGSGPSNQAVTPSGQTETGLNHISPEMIRPYPHAAPRTMQNRGRKRGRCRILTDTPEKAQLEEEVAVRMQKQTSRSAKRRLISRDSPSSNSSVELTLETDDDLSDASEKSGPNPDSGMQVGDFWMTTIMGKKRKHSYVAEVIGIDRDIIEVKFLKRVDKTNRPKFVKDKDEIYEIERKDAIMRLPKPKATGGSERRRQQLSFGVKWLQEFDVE